MSAIAAPLGILLVPLLSKSLYERFMTFLVALGIGALSGSSLFILIPQARLRIAPPTFAHPQAFHINELETFDYTERSWIILAALYGFVAVDRCLQYFFELRRVRKLCLNQGEGESESQTVPAYGYRIGFYVTFLCTYIG